MKSAEVFLLSVMTLSLGGCGASVPSPTTGSTVTQNYPMERALDIGATSARGSKCGYNFDPAKLRNQFLASESAANPADATKLAQVYDAAFDQTSKLLAPRVSEYCTESNVARIKLALARYLQGDYSPTPSGPAQDNGGLFGSWGSARSSGYESAGDRLHSQVGGLPY